MKKTSTYRRLRRIFGLLVLLTCCASASGWVIYVDADAPGAGDGTSWENAYNFLQDALAAARSAPSTGANEIWVAQGVYTPDSNSTVPEGTGDREASFEFIGSRNLTLRGGYAGFCGSDPNTRDLDLYKTILSGDLTGDDGPDFSNYDENSYHVILAIGAATTTIDGFTITAGNATGIGGFPVPTGASYVPEVWHDSGGGVYSSVYCSPTFQNCIFLKNKAIWGAGVHNSGDLGKPILKNCLFSDNAAFGGAGMFSGGFRNVFQPTEYFQPVVELDNCTFEGNSADLGGGVFCQSYGYTFLSVASVTDCSFVENTATFYGGAIHNDRGKLTVKACDFVGNTTLVGGGLIGGGAIHSTNAEPLGISNCVFSGNASAAVGGAIYAGSCRPGTRPCGGVGATVDTSTFAGNKAAQCGGAICFGIGKSTISNCILWGNIAPDGKEIAVDPFNIDASFWWSDVEGGKAGVFYMEPDCRTTCLPNDPNCTRCSLGWWENIDPVDPCFADPGYWDDNGTPDDGTDDFWVNGDYHLKSETGRWDPSLMSWVQDYVTSPLIDRGGNATSRCSSAATPPCYEPAPHSGRMNIGAYARTVEASKACFSRSICGILMEGDLNGDCLVNGMDLAIMAQHWVEPEVFDYNASWCNAFVAGDMDYTTDVNRRIDFRDLLVLALHWCEQN